MLVKIWRGTDLGARGQELNLGQVGLIKRRCHVNGLLYRNEEEINIWGHWHNDGS